MKLKHLLLLALAAPTLATAQKMVVDTSKWVDYVDNTNYDWSLMRWQGEGPMPGSRPMGPYAAEGSYNEMTDDQVQNRTDLPTHVNAADTKWFPPVFNQDNGSCGSASRICYMLTYELNAYRDLDGSLLENQLPSHFVWNLTYGNSGKDEFIQFVGVPSAKAYGGRTSSSIYGSFNWDDPKTGWMSGYDKWYEGFFNRAHKPSNFPISMKYAAGRKALKSWLYDHNGDPDFKGRPGIVGIGVASANGDAPIANTPANAEAGVVGKRYLTNWGIQVDHALTIVGYDDRIEFDLDGDGIYGEGDLETDDPWGYQPLEKGAWIVVNSWGPWWANAGFIYCPYAWSVPNAIDNNGHLQPSNGWWTPEVYRIRKDYAPTRTIKIEMEYTRRSEMALSVGVSSDLNATAPDKSIPMHHFQYAGDGANGDTKPAPEVPMLGQWRDGKFHHEPMEFGYDVSSLTEGYDRTRPLKYFFIIDRKRNSKLGKGKIHNLAILDYETSEAGMATPFKLDQENCSIDSAGSDHIVWSTIVYGSGSTYSPENLSADSTQLNWCAPLKSRNTLKGYNIYRQGELEATVSATTLTYTTQNVGEYYVTANYAEGESYPSNKVFVEGADKVDFPSTNIVKGGFTIPDVFGTNHENVTIEYWIKPNSIASWNQAAGSWGTWMMHANGDGSFTAGWNTSTNDRISTPSQTLTVGAWTHIGIVVKGKTLTIYTNGAKSAQTSSKSYSGIGGFGNLTFHSSAANNNNTDAELAEIRIWGTALTGNNMKNYYNQTVGAIGGGKDLLAHYRGDLIYIDGKPYLRDCVGGHHAPISLCEGVNGASVEQANNRPPRLKPTTATLKVSVDKPSTTIMVGQPCVFTATPSRSAESIVWNIPAAGIVNSSVTSPTVTFQEAGEQIVVAKVFNSKNAEAVDTLKVNVVAPEVNAEFTASTPTCAVGQGISFSPVEPIFGYEYEWVIEQANGSTLKQYNMVAATTFEEAGIFRVQLNVKYNDKTLATSEKFIEVKNVAPTADFSLSLSELIKGQSVDFIDHSKASPKSWSWNVYNDYNNMIISGRNPVLTFDKPGVYNVSLTVGNEYGTNTKTVERALTVSNGDAKSGLNIAGGAEVQLSKVPFSSGPFTIEWWMAPSSLTIDGNLGFGHYGGTMGAMVHENGQMLLEITGVPFKSKAGYVIAQEWHHYGVSFDGQRAKFYRDGVLEHVVDNGTPVDYKLSMYYISRYDYNWNGVVDEYRIWNKCLTDEKVLDVCNRSLEAAEDLEAAKAEGLVCYFTFNQSGGNVQDITGNGHIGFRNFFGPDGDAWSVRPGVWSLSIGQTPLTAQDVTADYLKNYQKQFKYYSQTVNNNVANRFYQIKNWKLENTITKTSNGKIVTGAHVDAQKAFCFTVTTGWDGFESTLTDHKAYQTITLPAGVYEFTAHYGTYEKQSDNSYLVVAKAGQFPVTNDLEQAIAYTEIKEYTNSGAKNTLKFMLSEETEVDLGMLFNMSGDLCVTFDHFSLTRLDAEVIVADYSYTLNIGSNLFNTVCLPVATTIPNGVKAYYVSSIDDAARNMNLTLIEGNVIPAETGVVLHATNAGSYIFRESSEAATDACTGNLLYGTLTDEKVGEEQTCFSLSENAGRIGFYPYAANSLQANRAYYFGNEADVYYLTLTDTGLNTSIEGVATQSAKNGAIYDLFGRRVNKVEKGIYIVNGKKVIR